MILVKKSREIEDMNLSIGMFKNQSKNSNVDFFDLYNQYLTKDTSIRKMSKQTGIQQTVIHDKFKMIRNGLRSDYYGKSN